MNEKENSSTLELRVSRSGEPGANPDLGVCGVSQVCCPRCRASVPSPLASWSLKAQLFLPEGSLIDPGIE